MIDPVDIILAILIAFLAREWFILRWVGEATERDGSAASSAARSEPIRKDGSASRSAASPVRLEARDAPPEPRQRSDGETRGCPSDSWPRPSRCNAAEDSSPADTLKVGGASLASPVIGTIWRSNYIDVLTQDEAEYWELNVLPMGWSIIRDDRTSPVRLTGDGAGSTRLTAATGAADPRDAA